MKDGKCRFTAVNGAPLFELFARNARLSEYFGKCMQGTLFDIVPTAALARKFLDQRDLANRCDVIDGDFFIEVPHGYDAYLFKSVVHDFDDDDAIKILENCRRAIADNARLLIIEEVVVPRQMMGNTHKFVDLDLLVHFGGKERTGAEYEKLLKVAKFKLERITPVKDSFSRLSKRCLIRRRHSKRRPLYPRKQTFAASIGMSARCHKRT